MSKTAYPPSVGITDPDIVEIRIGTGIKTKDHIIKVKHRLFGWITVREWGFVRKITDTIDKMDPVDALLVGGLTVTFKSLFDAGVDIVSIFMKFVVPSSGGLLASVDGGPLTGAAVSAALGTFLGPFAVLIGGVVGALTTPQESTEAAMEQALGNIALEIGAWGAAFIAALLAVKFGPSIIEAVGNAIPF